MKHLKQIMSIVLAAVLLFSGMTVSVQAEEISLEASGKQDEAESLEKEDEAEPLEKQDEAEPLEKEGIEAEQTEPVIDSAEELPEDAAPQIPENVIQTEETTVEDVVNNVGESCLAAWPNQVVVWPIGNSQRSNIRGVVRPFV